MHRRTATAAVGAAFVFLAAGTACGRASEPSQPAGALGFWNVGNYAAVPTIGRFRYRADDGTFRHDGIALVPSSVPWIHGTGGWIKSPSAVIHGNRIHLYFASYNGVEWTGVGLAILDREGRRARVVGIRPVLARQSGMGYYGTEFPRVLYDAQERDLALRWKMWVAADPAVAYATSPDGIDWRYHGPVRIAPSPFNTKLTMPASIVRDGGWWYLFTQEMGTDTRWVSGLVRSRSPSGPFERVGPTPLLPYRTGDAAVVSLEAGEAVATVSDATAFAAGEPVFLKAESGVQLNRVVAVAGDKLVLRDPATRAYTGGSVRTWAWDTYLTHVWRERGRWRGLGTGFHSSFPHENTLLAHPAHGRIDDRWLPDLRVGMPLWPGVWTSAENPVLAR